VDAVTNPTGRWRVIPYQLPILIPEALTIIAVGALVLAFLGCLVAIVAVRRERRLAAHYAAVMTGADGADLAAALEAFSRRLTGVEGRVTHLEGRAGDLDTRLRRALQRVRLLRYSAFQEAGGDQSFAVALLDDARDGIVLSGLYGRAGMRVYAKPVAGGRSPHALSTEEERVIAEAAGAGDAG
jgi:hypothetical protein